MVRLDPVRIGPVVRLLQSRLQGSRQALKEKPHAAAGLARELSIEEVTSWGGHITLMLYYYQYSDVALAIGFSPQSPDLDPRPQGRTPVTVFCNPSLMLLLNSSRRFSCLPETTRNYRFCLLVEPEMLELCGEPILEIGFEGIGRLVSKPISWSRSLDTANRCNPRAFRI